MTEDIFSPESLAQRQAELEESKAHVAGYDERWEVAIQELDETTQHMFDTLPLTSKRRVVSELRLPTKPLKLIELEKVRQAIRQEQKRQQERLGREEAIEVMQEA